MKRENHRVSWTTGVPKYEPLHKFEFTPLESDYEDLEQAAAEHIARKRGIEISRIEIATVTRFVD